MFLELGPLSLHLSLLKHLCLNLHHHLPRSRHHRRRQRPIVRAQGVKWSERNPCPAHGKQWYYLPRLSHHLSIGSHPVALCTTIAQSDLLTSPLQVLPPFSAAAKSCCSLPCHYYGRVMGSVPPPPSVAWWKKVLGKEPMHSWKARPITDYF